MLRFTTTITLAILCLAKLSLSRPVPRNEKGELIDINIQLIPGLDIGLNVGCGDKIVDVNLNSMHLPLIPCTNTQKSISTTGVTLPLIGRNTESKSVELATLPSSTGRVNAINSSIRSLPSTSASTSISISEFIGPVIARDSLIPKFSIVTTSTSIKIDSRRLHTHHRPLAANPPPTIFIEPIPTSTNPPKIKHTHHRLTKTSKAIQYTSAHPYPLTAQTPIKRLEAMTMSLSVDLRTVKPISAWISPPEAKLSILPFNKSSSEEKTTLVTKASGSSSIRRATWHPPAETLYPPVVERGAPNKAWKRTTRWHPSAESSYPPVVGRGS
ncbi:uncharacterized protein EAE97_007434 [Botrytis byssoidea]|uniref:Uncharacterized protein n=1 Tax=Botrytis byssoidea TaxID=139641 RepID=A0A9P5M1D4_9HELO|nr:uncharacterized protein EAE97_007434 [Botrytis byssoidea]KAF7939354.1 hypothetical protein EAE97_007434 [Botrytis byssoidea]